MSCPLSTSSPAGGDAASEPLPPVAKIGDTTLVRLPSAVDTVAWAPVMREFITGRAEDQIRDEHVVVIGYPMKELKLLRSYLVSFGLMLVSYYYFPSLVAVDPDHVRKIRVFLYSEEADISQLIPHLG